MIQRVCESSGGQNLQDQFTGADVAYTAENVTGGAPDTPRSRYAGFSWVVPFTQSDLVTSTAPTDAGSALVNSGCTLPVAYGGGINDMMVGLCDANAELIGNTSEASIPGDQLLFGFHYKGSGTASADVFEIVTGGTSPYGAGSGLVFQQAFQQAENYQLRLSLRNTIEFLWKGVLIYESNVTAATLKPCAFFGDIGSRIENVSWVHRDNYRSLRDAVVDDSFVQMEISMAALINTTESGLQANIDTASSTIVASIASSVSTQTANLNGAVAVVEQNLSDVRSELAEAASSNMAAISVETARATAVESQLRALVSTQVSILTDTDAAIIVASVSNATAARALVTSQLAAMASTTQHNLDAASADLTAAMSNSAANLSQTITALDESAAEGRAQLLNQTSLLFELAAHTADENYERLENHTDNTRDVLEAVIAEVIDSHELHMNLTDTSIGAIHAAIADIVAVDESQSDRLESLETQVAHNVANITEERRLTTLALDLLSALHLNETAGLAAELETLAALSNASDVSLSVLVRELNASLLAGIDAVRSELNTGIDGLNVGLSSASAASDDDKKESSTKLMIAVAVGSLVSTIVAVVVTVLVLRSKVDADRSSPAGLQRTTPDYLQGKVKTVGMVSNPVYPVSGQAELEARTASGDGGYFEDPGYQAEDAADGASSFRRKSILRNNPLAESQTDGVPASEPPGI